MYHLGYGHIIVCSSYLYSFVNSLAPVSCNFDFEVVIPTDILKRYIMLSPCDLTDNLLTLD